MSKPPSDAKALPLGDTLRDLALLRASDIDLAAILQEQPISQVNPSATGACIDEEKEKLVDRSYEFVRETRAALRLVNRDEVNDHGKRIEGLRSELEDATVGMNVRERDVASAGR